MQIEVKGRNLPVTDELRERIHKKFAKVGRQVSPFARLEVELLEEANPAIPESEIAEVTLYLKGQTLRAREATTGMAHSINLVADEIARQVKRHGDKRRARPKASRRARLASVPPPGAPGPATQPGSAP